MKYIAKPSTELPKQEAIDTPLMSDVSIAKLIRDCLVILSRETKNLMILSVRGKMDAASARDLRDNLKLLFELKDREQGLLDELSQEEIDNLTDNKETKKDEL